MLTALCILQQAMDASRTARRDHQDEFTTAAEDLREPRCKKAKVSARWALPALAGCATYQAGAWLPWL